MLQQIRKTDGYASARLFSMESSGQLRDLLAYRVKYKRPKNTLKKV
jgi:hypothetical protein